MKKIKWHGVKIYHNAKAPFEEWTILFPVWATRNEDTYEALIVHRGGGISHADAPAGRHLGKLIPWREVDEEIELKIRAELGMKPGATVTMYRQPTASETRFGEGAEHFCDFDAIDLVCQNADGRGTSFVTRYKNPADGLIYSRSRY